MKNFEAIERQCRGILKTGNAILMALNNDQPEKVSALMVRRGNQLDSLFGRGLEKNLLENAQKERLQQFFSDFSKLEEEIHWLLSELMAGRLAKLKKIQNRNEAQQGYTKAVETSIFLDTKSIR